MYASPQSRHVPYSWLLRWCAGAGGAIVIVAWLVLVILEAATARQGFGSATADIYYQAAALAIVFAGYALGWRYELAGAVLTILGTAAFFAIPGLTIGSMPSLSAAWFALPAVFYLLAWQTERMEVSRRERLP